MLDKFRDQMVERIVGETQKQGVNAKVTYSHESPDQHEIFRIQSGDFFVPVEFTKKEMVFESEYQTVVQDKIRKAVAELKEASSW